MNSPIKFERLSLKVKKICDSTMHAILKNLCSGKKRLNNLILITCIRSNLDYHVMICDMKNMYFRSENKNTHRSHRC